VLITASKIAYISIQNKLILIYIAIYIKYLIYKIIITYLCLNKIE
jgi:hypothetical protein